MTVMETVGDDAYLGLLPCASFMEAVDIDAPSRCTAKGRVIPYGKEGDKGCVFNTSRSLSSRWLTR
ncbi:hypothetical protein DVU_0023 [Nitratidesulfovibrio vulgaris str. Hildenborough]|uniref:Uncharacterized protein n=1 Tax=Nitratidesulfovibrio vulgaris (strain ATCC 29579 / DSM 644 / CCUG 34227 / NCIMB 8303 / VKM B-1760 / Hildenborough) TaxID=882 RepID=Q72G38_NITV2|nr:hypothetical protein DVU_0023 [Nitratidesulfovibrio vulgaris str. Hildenborough]